MTAKYHISDNGEPAICNATVRPCPKGEDAPHFESAKGARKFQEQQMTSKNFTALSKDRSLDPAEIFTAIDNAPEDVSLIRKGDFSFARGTEINDPFDTITIKSVTPTDVSVQRENIELDGTIGLRIGITVDFKGTGGNKYESESAAFWFTTDGHEVVADIIDLPGESDIEFNFDDTKKLASRFGLA